MNDKFFDLKKEKQDKMINGAMQVFALKGYKLASTDDMVKVAGVSKGFSNGKLSAGFQGVNVSEKSFNLKGDKTGFAGNGTFNPATDGFVWTIPVCFEYWF